MANRFKKEEKKRGEEFPSGPISESEWDKLMHKYEDKNQYERMKESLTPELRHIDKRAAELQKEADEERERKYVTICGQKLEMERVGVDAYYAYVESDDLQELDVIREEVENQGLETNLSKAEGNKYRLEFARK